MRETIENIFQFAKDLINSENKLSGLPFFNKDFFDDFFNRPAIYFLLDDKDKIIYIGQTTSLLYRLSSHIYGIRGTEKKNFNGASWLFVKQEELDFAEAIFLNLYRPPLNKHIPRLKQVHYAFSEDVDIDFNEFQKNNNCDFSQLVKFWLQTANDSTENVDIFKYNQNMRDNK